MDNVIHDMHRMRPCRWIHPATADRRHDDDTEDIMIIQTTRRTLDAALTAVSSIHDDNIRWRDIRPMTDRTDVTPDERIRYRCTITVHDTDRSGASYDPIRGRRISAACWHVHGQLFDIIMTMDPVAVIRTAATVIRTDDTGRVHGNWIDYDRGSMIYPASASEFCHCHPSTLRGQTWTTPVAS